MSNIRNAALPGLLKGCANACVALLLASHVHVVSADEPPDPIRELQTQAVKNDKADWGHWGTDATKYTSWTTHSNRLIPVYTYGITLEDVKGEKSVYRDEARLRELYNRLPTATLNPDADYFDQTDIYHLQKAAADAGKKYIVLVVFDGMDWQTTWAAAVYKHRSVGYREGPGTGLFWQDYRGAVSDFGFMVTSPYCQGVKMDVNAQTISNPGGDFYGGYDWKLGGSTPWDHPADSEYLIAKSRNRLHAYTDSAASASSMTSGIKTYNDSINIDPFNRQAPTIAHQLQQQGYAIGVLTSVPISHATPACAYSHNVNRDDYQDLTRDLIGLPSIAHPQTPLPGVDVLLGGGWGEKKDADAAQGTNYVPGNRYLTEDDQRTIDVAHGGAYVIAERSPGSDGKTLLAQAASRAVMNKQRLLGFFGVGGGHLPFQTADGRYDPTFNGSDHGAKVETYTSAEIAENPTLADLTSAALDVLGHRSDKFWLMVEAGDVDWANHANNIDNSIGAVLSGDAAFKVITDWVEAHDAWNDTAIILTADHGHYLVLEHPETLAQ